jgi:hypothetical protein
VVTVVVLVMSIITSIVSSVVVTIIMAIITTITYVVIAPVIAVITTVVVAPVIAAVVVVVIMSIPIVVARIGPAITVISSIRSTVMIVVVVVASGLLGGRRDSKGSLQLLALPHGVFSIAVELTLVVHDHIEVTFEEGGRSWWIYHIGFTGTLARPVPPSS